MNLDKVKLKYNLTDDDVCEILCAAVKSVSLLSADQPTRKGAIYNQYDSLKKYIETCSKSGKGALDVRTVRDNVKKKVAFKDSKNLTSFIRVSLADLEGTGLIYDVDGDNFKIKPFTTTNN